MKEYQLNQKEMFGMVLTYMNNTVAKWSTIPKIGVVKNELENRFLSITEKSIEQDKAQTYLSMEKKQLKRLIAEKADILNDQVEAYAQMEGMPDLAVRMNQSKSELFLLKNEMFIEKIGEVIQETENHIETLSADYGVTTEQVSDLDTDLDNFKGLNGMPRKYQIDSIIATKDLEVLFAETNALLNEKLDKLMKIFKRRDASFYNGYLAARIIVNN